MSEQEKNWELIKCRMKKRTYLTVVGFSKNKGV